MNKKLYSVVILLSLAAPALVGAADTGDKTVEVHGTVGLGLQVVDSTGDEARFQEFREMDDSVLGNIQLDAIKDAYHFQFDADRIGLDDQSFQAKGGNYGNFKYRLNYDELVHNYGFDAIAPYLRIGTQQITPVADPADTDTWTKFDYSVEHKRYGGELEVSLNSPFFVNLGVDRNEQNGLRPYGTDRPDFAEVAEPISNSTNNLNLKAGYRGESLTTSLSGSLSSFSNDHLYMNTDDATNDVSNFSAFAPDNDYSKIAADLAYRNLPLGSVLSAAASYAKLEDDFSASDLNLPAAFAAGTWTIGGLAGLNTDRFDGEIDYTSFSIALASNPLDKLDTKIYYDYRERDNKSSFVSYGVAPVSSNNAQELPSTEKNAVGLDVGYRFPYKTKVDGGYEHVSYDRSTALPAFSGPNNFYRYDNPESNTDDAFYIGLKNSALDWLTAKLRYKMLERDSDINTSAVVAAGNDPTIYTTRFDAADKSRDEWKLSLDLYPVDKLDLGLEYTNIHDDYDWNNSSINDDQRHNVYADATWRAVESLTLSGFVGYEITETESNKRLNLAPTLDHIETIDDDYWTYGLAAKVAATEKLSFDLSWQYDESDGEVNFDNSLLGTTYENITESDDYTKKRLEAKANYAIDAKLGMTVGYVYEKFEYSDINYLNFANIVGTEYYSGLYANQNYEANIGYLMVNYGF